MFDVVQEMFSMNPGVVVAIVAFFVMVLIAVIAAIVATVATTAGVETRDKEGTNE
ncbi:MAG: hypothetical protein IK007_08870 [Lachnospiraceae bacterium]|nr:hypothetical protein [Lachnospiraceae bacterium]